MNFAPVWKAVLAGEMDLFQVQALCELDNWQVSQAYLASKFNRYLARDNDRAIRKRRVKRTSPC